MLDFKGILSATLVDSLVQSEKYYVWDGTNNYIFNLSRIIDTYWHIAKYHDKYINNIWLIRILSCTVQVFTSVWLDLISHSASVYLSWYLAIC